MKISVFGLGKLGAAIAAVVASKGHEVIGVDLDERAVSAINRGEPPIDETGLADLMKNVRDHLSATTDGASAVAATDLSILIVPTPSEAHGGFSLDIIRKAAETVGHGLKSHSGYHVVSISSTVLPGATEGVLIPAIEQASGKKCGKDFGLVYSPEFVALGNVIHDLQHPDIVLIGQHDKRAGDIVEDMYRSVVVNQPAILRMNIVNAEITKLSVNTFVTTKISFASMLSEICEQLVGADAQVVTGAIGRDSRIGMKFIRPGAAYGGPCFPRDNKALSYLARTLGARAILAEATDQVNKGQTDRLVALAVDGLSNGASVGVLGMSYKPDTVVVDESAGLHLARGLSARNVPVSVFDPRAMEQARGVLGNSVSYANSAQACIDGSDVIVLATAWPDFKSVSYGTRVRKIIDCWRMLDPAKLHADITYIALGKGR